MDDLSLTHSRYNCTYYIVFIPKQGKEWMERERTGEGEDGKVEEKTEKARARL